LFILFILFIFHSLAQSLRYFTTFRSVPIAHSLHISTPILNKNQTPEKQALQGFFVSLFLLYLKLKKRWQKYQ